MPKIDKNLSLDAEIVGYFDDLAKRTGGWSAFVNHLLWAHRYPGKEWEEPKVNWD